MPLTILNLDDRNFTDLVEEGISMLARFAPVWTNHNPSDPGMTLIELLAYFTEMLIYRLNRVTRDNKIKFLQLLREVEPAERMFLASPQTPLEKVDDELKRAVLGLRELQRAVTPNDYEELAKRVRSGGYPNQPGVVRARCFERRNLEESGEKSRLQDSPGHVSVVIVPDSDLEPDQWASLLKHVRETIEPKRLLTTRLHVVQPSYLQLTIGAVIRTRPDFSLATVQTEAINKLQQYFNPLPGGGPDAAGWPFGRAVYLSEVYERLEQIEGVDHVRDVRILNLDSTGRGLDDARTALGIQIGVRSTVGVDSRLGVEPSVLQDRLLRDASGKLVAVMLRSYELVRITVRESDLVSDDASVRQRSLRRKLEPGKKGE